jgi:hypothetical protein
MAENRAKNYKNKGKDNEELRRRRNEVLHFLICHAIKIESPKWLVVGLSGLGLNSLS